ncbi:MAG: tRNA (adenosine(37)-N6)-threonylcarbamoyltransferase complex ATPase subunit type 1 TsaE [Flavobacteriaceae bacterium TMED208]|nr:MAG: tRNA (adenosine(37)-N6)-threonylcarbamoyltransferase complex ATPase subunit type 1 TsaE [Flavobacteriaceae bacterium TMED208]|tara:strand:- start:204 stop:620 length:417 start_codon:yes stop_codon:yes gene_type:complete
MLITYELSDINAISNLLIQDFSTKVIRIDGDMGTGKTTLISSLCKSLGVKETISSPTFSLVNTYHIGNEKIYHFDFYRLKNENEAIDFGLEEYLESGNICFMEWAEKISSHLPLEYDHYILNIVDEKYRKIESKRLIS